MDMGRRVVGLLAGASLVLLAACGGGGGGITVDLLAALLGLVILRARSVAHAN